MSAESFARFIQYLGKGRSGMRPLFPEAPHRLALTWWRQRRADDLTQEVV
jgi:hypothetical protein